MPSRYYGTVPVLAWIINHFFYGGVHFAWLAEGFHPLRTNPHSSNPYVIYGSLQAAWAYADNFDKFVAQWRLGLRGGVIHKAAGGALDVGTAARLKDLCDRVAVELFYPVVYRVDVDAVDPARRERAGSALAVGSREYLIRDLRETEFDLLFLDNGADPDFQRLVVDEVSGASATSAADALAVLEGRMVP